MESLERWVSYAVFMPSVRHLLSHAMYRHILFTSCWFLFVLIMLFPGPIVVLLLLAPFLQQCPLVHHMNIKCIICLLSVLLCSPCPAPRNKGEMLANAYFVNFPSPCGLNLRSSSKKIKYSSEITPEFEIVADAWADQKSILGIKISINLNIRVKGFWI